MGKSPKCERQGTLAESAAVFAVVLGVLMYGILGLKLSAHLPLGCFRCLRCQLLRRVCGADRTLVFCGLADAPFGPPVGAHRYWLSRIKNGKK